LTELSCDFGGSAVLVWVKCLKDPWAFNVKVREQVLDIDVPDVHTRIEPLEYRSWKRLSFAVIQTRTSNLADPAVLEKKLHGISEVVSERTSRIFRQVRHVSILGL
jgi:hypothetical protein